MLDRRPFLNDRLSMERESYFRYQQIFERQCMNEKHFYCPIPEKVNEYHVPEKLKCNDLWIPDYLAPYNFRYIQGKPLGPSDNNNGRTAPVNFSNSGVNFNHVYQRWGQRMSRNRVMDNAPAFGPACLEHAKNFYQLQGAQAFHDYDMPSFRSSWQNLPNARGKPTALQQQRRNTNHKCPLVQNSGHHLIRPKLEDHTQAVSNPLTSTYRIATISPRPGRKQKGLLRSSLSVDLRKCTTHGIAKKKLSRSKIMEELCDSPIFQMLNELSKAG